MFLVRLCKVRLAFQEVYAAGQGQGRIRDTVPTRHAAHRTTDVSCQHRHEHASSDPCRFDAVSENSFGVDSCALSS